MGVRGLQTYIEKHAPGALTKVSLPQMVHEFKLKNPDQKDVVIVVDGSNCAIWLYGNADWVCGGQWREFREKLQNFVEAFQKIGVHLVFFFDGMNKTVSHTDTWQARRLRTYEQVMIVFSCLKAGMPVPSDDIVIPPNFMKMVRISLKHIPGVTVCHNVFNDCDKTIASYAKKHNCMAILAQDTDYIIFPTVPYISMKHLNLTNMETFTYSRKKLCAQFTLEVHLLPFFACLIGNGSIPEENLKLFHNWACRSFGHRPQQRSPKFINLETRIQCVGRCLSRLKQYGGPDNLGSTLRDRCPELFDASFSPEKFQECAKAYDLNCDQVHLFPHPGDTDITPEQGTVDDICEVVVRKTANLNVTSALLEILSLGIIELHPSLGDKDGGSLAPALIVYRPIRQRVYHLILAFRDGFMKKGSVLPFTGYPVQQSNYVEEWFANSSNTVLKEKVIAGSLNLSDNEIKNSLYEFLTQDDCEELKQKKWNVFREAMGVTMVVKTLLEIPDQFKSMCMILNYLIQSPQVPLQLWEVETFIVQAVHPAFLDVKRQQDLQVKPYNARAVHLAAMFLQGIGVAHIASAMCGNPIRDDYHNPHYFFDGKSFHHCYVEMLKHKDATKVLPNEESCLKHFHELKVAILEGIDLKQCFQ